MSVVRIALFSVLAVALVFASSLDPRTALAQGKGIEDRKCRHILIPTEKRADELAARLEKGESFANLARRHSFDVVTKPLAGELGWIGTGRYEAAFMQAAYTIPKVNGVVKCQTTHGWHLIQMTAIKNAGGRKPASATAGKPSSQPDRVRPPRSTINKDIQLSINLLQRAVGIGEEVQIEITVHNNSKVPQNVFNPALWPLGLTARYHDGRLNVPLEFPSEGQEPEGGFSRELGPGEELTQKFTLQDYTGDLAPWPIIRVNWRANVYFRRLERRFPGIRGIESYDKIREQWKYYATREDHRLNVLPDFDPSQRWFVMLNLRGKVWIELEDPGIPGLLEHWIDVVRQSTYNRQPFTHHSEGSHFNAGGIAEDGSGQADATFDLPPGVRPAPVDPYTLALEATKTRESLLQVGSRYYLTLDSPTVRGIPIGKVISGKGTEVLDAIASQYEIRGQSPRTMLALIYPYDLLPDNVRSIVESTEAPVAQEPRPRVLVTTGIGPFTIELFEDDAPNSVANFVNLVEAGFYDGLTFHDKWRSVDNLGFVQTGSPDGTRDGNAGYSIKDETNQRKHRRGTVAFAKKGTTPNSSSSQFYICMEAQPYFDGMDTVIGRVVEGMDVVLKLRKGTKLESIKVARKRSHEYKLQKLEATSKPSR